MGETEEKGDERIDTIDGVLQQLGTLRVLVLQVTPALGVVVSNKEDSRWVQFNAIYTAELRGTSRQQFTTLLRAVLDRRDFRWRLSESGFYYDRYSFDAQGSDNREALRKLLEDFKNAYS